jgi:hypothetical protein
VALRPQLWPGLLLSRVKFRIWQKERQFWDVRKLDVIQTLIADFRKGSEAELLPQISRLVASTPASHRLDII